MFSSKVIMKNIVQQCGRAIQRLSVLIAPALLITIMYMGGCAQQQVRTLGRSATPTIDRVSKEELRQALSKFEELSLTKIKEAASELDELSHTPKMRKTTLLWRSRQVQALHSVLDQEDPIVSLIDVWALCVRMTNYFEAGEGSSLFAKHQDIAIRTTKELELEIERISKTLLGEEVFLDTHKHIHGFGRANPIQGTFSNMVVYATQIKEGQTNYLTSVISIPMAPFKAIGGVDRTATAINRFTDTARGFSDVVEAFPESTRWQLLLLLYDLEDTEMAKSFLASMSEFSQSSTRIADSTEKLPEQLREQLSILVEEIDAKQASLQTTLDKAKKTAATVERSLAKVDEVADSVGQTANSINEAAVAWEKSAEATKLALKEFGKLKPARKDPNSKSSFNINDYRDTAETVTMAANELRTLTVEVREFVESDAVTKYALAVERCTNHLAWRIVQLLLLIFVLALVYKIVVRRHSAFRRPA